MFRGCSGGVPGCSGCVPGCSGVFRGVPGFTDTRLYHSLSTLLNKRSTTQFTDTVVSPSDHPDQRDKAVANVLTKLYFEG